MRRVDELEALEVLLASLEVVDHEWLKEKTGQDERTPDLRLELASGREVIVEVIQHTYSAQRHLFSADGIEVESEDLNHRWKLVISDPSASDASLRKSRPIRSLLELLVPVLRDAESEGITPEGINKNANH